MHVSYCKDMRHQWFCLDTRMLQAIAAMPGNVVVLPLCSRPGKREQVPGQLEGILFIKSLQYILFLPRQYCLSRMYCFLLFCSALRCVPDALTLLLCSDDSIFIPIQNGCSFAQKGLASSALHSAATIWRFPRLFSVPTLNAAITVVTGGEGMLGLCPFQQLPPPCMLMHLCRGQKDKCGLGITFSGNLLTL